MSPVTTLPLDAKVKLVVTNAAGKLPAAVGQELAKLIEPQALALMVGVLTAWGLATSSVSGSQRTLCYWWWAWRHLEVSHLRRGAR